MTDKIHEPKTALAALLKYNGISGYKLVKEGYFSSTSSVYTVGKKDIRSMNVKTIVNVSKALKMKPGSVLDTLLEIQKSYPPKKLMKK